jgi:hypothetical protein
VTPSCPTCGSAGRPVLFGLPAPEANEAAAEGKLILRGCIEPEDFPHWECSCGHEWASDENEWTEALIAVLSGRPHCSSCGGPTNYLVYPGAEEFFLDELARGDAELAQGLAEAGDWTRICRTCRALF